MIVAIHENNFGDIVRVLKPVPGLEVVKRSFTGRDYHTDNRRDVHVFDQAAAWRSPYAVGGGVAAGKKPKCKINAALSKTNHVDISSTWHIAPSYMG